MTVSRITAVRTIREAFDPQMRSADWHIVSAERIPGVRPNGLEFWV